MTLCAQHRIFVVGRSEWQITRAHHLHYRLTSAFCYISLSCFKLKYNPASHQHFYHLSFNRSSLHLSPQAKKVCLRSLGASLRLVDFKVFRRGSWKTSPTLASSTSYCKLLSSFSRVMLLEDNMESYRHARAAPQTPRMGV